MDPKDLYFGNSAAPREVLDRAADLAPTPFPVLLLGPTGSGKTDFARYIHALSGRSGEFVQRSLSEIPEHLWHTSFAGHVKGAYTGAGESSSGLVEEAQGGTLFLDELHLATTDVQSRLLQILERPYTIRVRDTLKRYVDVRYLFATNRDPLELRRRGVWGDDFFFRLGYNHIRLPTLAERRDEIMALAERFLGRYLAALGKPWAPRFSPEVEQRLLGHPWPGNIIDIKLNPTGSPSNTLRTEMKFDAAGRLTSYTSQKLNSGVNFAASTSITYNKVDDALSLTRTTPAASGVPMTFSYSTDGTRRLASEVASGGLSTT